MDCVIVGGEPAGLTAALCLARFLRSVIVIDAGNGRACFPEGISGGDMVGRMRKHAKLYGASVDVGVVQSGAKKDEIFRIAAGAKVTVARIVPRHRGRTLFN